MNVDTADLGNLAEQVAALAAQVTAQGRKVSCLTGRVTILSAVVGRLDDSVQTMVHATEFGEILRRARRPPARHARPRRLKVVSDGRDAAPGAPVMPPRRGTG